MSRKPVVWITRPQPGADRTAKSLTQAGFEPLILPLTEIRACDPDLAIEDVRTFDAVAVTSANALRHASDALLEALRGKPVHTVGDATAIEARALGLAPVSSAGGAVDDLAALISEREMPGAAILYLCGRTRTGDLEGKLAKKGVSCRAAEVYETNIVSYMTEFLRDAVKRRAPDAILFHSGLAARTFRDYIHPSDPQLFDKTNYFVISARVAESLSQAEAIRITVAREPTEEALLAALQSAFVPLRN